jgi:GGDEF domain-containing protein
VSTLDEFDPEAVLHRADTAMYALKRQGRTEPS